MAIFSVENEAGQSYQLKCVNNSTTPWFFYMYQRLPIQSNGVYSLAWLVSPFKIAPKVNIIFRWTNDYSFAWSYSGKLGPGVNIVASENLPCSLTGPNKTTFLCPNNTPQFSPPITEKEQLYFTINVDQTVPSSMYSTGIGMSGQGIIFIQAMPFFTQMFALPSWATYYIACADQMNMGTVLPPENVNAQAFQFPQNVFALTATLEANNTWTIH